MKINEIVQNRFNKPENKGDEFGFTNQYSSNTKRIINKDGSFNVVRIGEKKSLFHNLITTSWTKFLLTVFTSYIIINLLFAVIYLVIDFDGIGMTSDYEVRNRFLVAYFFSAQTMTTVGYGSLYPLSAIVSTVAASEALIGLMSFAIFTGLMYGRFSKPLHGIRFSKNILYAPHKQGYSLMFRVANERDHHLTELEARVLINVIVGDQGKESRKYQSLQIENNKISYFPLNWTIVHFIDGSSPLYGMTREDFMSSQMEILVMIMGYNETAGQSFQAKSSYTMNELVWNSKFKIPYYFREDGVTVFELDKIDEFESMRE
ncbi:MAG TPA: ion channel [Saprospiraceae bacterium]|nr:ion channel [Saprospiraceae bacterium]